MSRPARAPSSAARGQAMTELLIVASFVLVPLFLLIPLLGKYIDVSHASIQAARYEAWEYTVWYERNADTPSGFTGGPQPVKSLAAVQRESRRRVFSDPSLELAGSDSSTGWLAADARPLWTDHRGLPIYAGAIGDTVPSGHPSSSLRSSEPTPTIPVIGDAVDAIIDMFGIAFDALGSLLGAIGSTAGFDVINTDGYATATVSVPIATDPGVIDVRTLHGETGADADIDIGDLTFSSQAAVLSDGWNAGGTRHAFDRTRGIVLSSVLDELFDAIPGFNTVVTAFGYIAPELRPCPVPGEPFLPHPFDPEEDGSIWLGYLDIDAVPPDRLESGGAVVCQDGFCDFDPAPTAQSPCDY